MTNDEDELIGHIDALESELAEAKAEIARLKDMLSASVCAQCGEPGLCACER